MRLGLWCMRFGAEVGVADRDGIHGGNMVGMVRIPMGIPLKITWELDENGNQKIIPAAVLMGLPGPFRVMIFDLV